MKTLPPPKARELLLSRTKERDEATTHALLDALGRHPAAVALASRYLETAEVTLAEYLRRYLAKQNEIIGRGTLIEEYPVLVAACLAVEKLLEHGPPLPRFIAMFSVLDEHIPISFLSVAGPKCPGELKEIMASPKAITPWLAALSCYGLIVSREDGVSFPHPLIQAAARRQLPQPVLRELAEFMLLITRLLFQFNPKDPATHAPSAKILPQLLSTIRHAETLGIGEEQLGVFLSVIGEYFLERQELAKSLSTFQRASAYFIRRKAAPPQRILNLLSDLSIAMLKKNDILGAEKVVEISVALLEAAFGKEHQALSPYLETIGLYREKRGDLKGEIIYLQRALAIDTANNNTTKEVAERALQLGNKLLLQKKITEARSCFEQALQIYESLTKPPALKHSEALFLLGYLTEDEPAKALDYYQRAVTVIDTNLGPENPVLPPMLDRVGTLLDEQGEPHKALEVCERALALYESCDLRGSLYSAVMLNRVGLLQEELGQPHEAKKNFEAALVILQQRQGNHHPNTSRVKKNLAALNEGKTVEPRAQKNLDLAGLKTPLSLRKRSNDIGKRKR